MKANYSGILLLLIGLLVSLKPCEAVDLCPQGYIFNPFSGYCAPVTDRRIEFKEGSEIKIPDILKNRNGTMPYRRSNGDHPIPGGGNGGGVSFKKGHLQVFNEAQLHIKMYVYPSGVNQDAGLDNLYTTATNRTEKSVEVVGWYSDMIPGRGQLGIWDWSCSLEYPCEKSGVEPGFQLTKDFSDFSCNMGDIAGKSGYSQKIIHYANMSTKIDTRDPPLWINSVYLWNFCSNGWDMVYSHKFRCNQKDCSIDNACGWWGPILEIFGDTTPKINILGFENAALLYDGAWSFFSDADTDFTYPKPPWEVFCYEPNRSFCIGTYAQVQCSGLWSGASGDYNGRKFLSWLGWFWSENCDTGWIYHDDHGWIYCHGNNTKDIWIWASDIGWLWTKDSYYPFLWHGESSSWIWYHIGSYDPRWFYNYGTGQWESYPKIK